uniref:Cytochrome c biogenesis protein Ccs1 n=1 Tax=Kuetzingia canaliculata TaxID=228262 RepID=A0A1Z1MNW6_KUECA|nr:cytochrome c biogenesis protein ccs1 [Kuetzingia canaliculata]ARW67793.1 cytochrome c biogenesis protein ccs1 [Kuetzingia canaliculata]
MKHFTFKNFLWYFFKQLARLNTAIGILIFIIFASIVGSIIEQDQTFSYYITNYPEFSSNIFIFNWKWIYYLGLNHVYDTWWFIFTIIIFILSLMTCTFLTQLPNLKNARRWKFMSAKLASNSSVYFIHNSLLNSYSFINAIYSLISTNFFVFHQKNSVYSYKGLYGRIAPIIVHFSIVFVLLGSILSFLFGFVTQELVPNGEIFHLKNVISSGLYSILPIDLFCRIENFYIDYNNDNSIKQFFSKISVFYRNYKFVNSRLVAVNSPLFFKGNTFYQTDWQVNALRFKLGSNKFIQKKLSKIIIDNKSYWICNFFISDHKEIFFLVFNLNDSIMICNSDGIIFALVNIGQKFYVNNILFSIEQIMTTTGLQIKVDPGINVIYCGFFMLMLTTIISYLSYSQIWVHGCHFSLELIGSTNRAVLFFEEDILQIKKYYKRYTFINLLQCYSYTNYLLK